jgi:hypothetical protein
MFTLKVWIQWQTSSRFALASNHDHKSSRSNQAHWQASCATCTHTPDHQTRGFLCIVVMGHVRTTYLKTGSSTISTGTDSTTHGRIFVGSKLQRLQRQTSDSGCFALQGCPFCPEQANRFRAKGAGGVHIGNFSSGARPQSLRQPSTYASMAVGRNQRLLFTRQALCCL